MPTGEYWVREGENLWLSFTATNDGFSNGYKISTSDGNALESLDYYQSNKSSGPYTFSEGKLAYTYGVSTIIDNLIEGDEYFLINHENIGSSPTTWKVNIIDMTGQLCFLDFNRDGAAQQNEIIAYENGIPLREMGWQIRSIERQLEILQETMALYSSEIKAGSASSISTALTIISPASKIVKGVFGKVGGDVVAQQLDFAETVLKTGDAAAAYTESQSGLDFFEYGINLLQLASGPAAVAAKSIQDGMALGDVLATSAGQIYYISKYNAAYNEWQELSNQLEKLESDLKYVECIDIHTSSEIASRTLSLVSEDAVVLGERTFSKLTEVTEKISSQNSVLGSSQADNFYLSDNFDDSFLSGDAGIDTVHINGFSDQIFLSSKDNFAVVSHRDNSVVTIDIERIKFLDGNIASDTDGNAGQAYRLYQAALDRAPESEGLGFWIKEFDAGNVDINLMAKNFINSDEFKAKYGTPSSVSDDVFLNLIYNNILDRDADDGGLAFWNGEMAKGLEREGVLASFSESAENQANVIGQIEDGIFYL